LTVLYLVAMIFLCADMSAEEGRTYYFQLICGSDKELPAKTGAKPVGPKLRSQFETKFRWKNWAELSHGECMLAENETRTIKLPEKREMQLELSGKTLEVRLYRGGQLVRRTRGNAETESVIMGGDQGRDEAWFIVIRHDKPSTITTAAEQAKRPE
jgi:hypothetical protein